MRKRNERGFSLIELLVVVAIILIISAIAIPKLLQAKVAANQSAVVGDLRAMLNAESTYSAAYGNYATTVSQLTTVDTPADCTGSGILDKTTWGGTAIVMSNYNFVFTSPIGTDTTQTSQGCTMAHSWSLSAVPVSSFAGTRGFYIDSNNTVLYSTDGSVPVPGTSPALGQ